MTRAWVLLALFAGCDDGSDDEGFDDDRGALENGQKCLFTAAGSNICAGSLCIGIANDSPFGVCSEVCGSSCKNGGECVEIEGVEGRACMVECAGSDGCGDGLSCGPSNGVKPCGPGGCAADLGRFWCQPPLPR